jgi:hypothetical protein
MTVRRQWMLVLMISVALSVLVNSFVLSTLINRYFIEYSTENYNQHIVRLITFSTEALSSDAYTEQQLEMQLETHLSDPINRIRLYKYGRRTAGRRRRLGVSEDGHDAKRNDESHDGGGSEEVDSIDVEKDGETIGTLIVTRYSSIGDSLGTREFTLSLIGNSLLSFGIVFLLTFILGFSSAGR